MRNATFLALGFALAAFATACGGDAAGGDAGAGRDTSGEVVHSFDECIAICEAAGDEESCEGLYLTNDFLADATLGCGWTTFTAKQLLADAGCADADSIERCQCFVSGSESDQPDYTIGCGYSVGALGYITAGGVPYLFQGSSNSLPLGSVTPCVFEADGTATPPECACFCDWQDDPAITCDYAQRVCVDAARGLMWDIRAFSVGSTAVYRLDEAEERCAASTLGGFEDWRLPSIDELRTLVRGCPRNEEHGACPVSEACPEVACAGDCTPCGGTDPVDPDDPCAFCAQFSGEPCGVCPLKDEDLSPPCYLPLDLAVPFQVCEPVWSATSPVETPDAGANTAWSIDTSRGAPTIMGDYEGVDGSYLAYAAVLCVRTFP